PAPIQPTVIAVALVAQAQPANTPGTAAEDVGGLEPGELPTQRSQDDLLDLHGALHGADGIGHGHLLGDQFSPDARLERSFHVALGSGQITYSRHAGRVHIDPPGRHGYSRARSPRRREPCAHDVMIAGTTMRTPLPGTGCSTAGFS